MLLQDNLSNHAEESCFINGLFNCRKISQSFTLSISILSLNFLNTLNDVYFPLI